MLSALAALVGEPDHYVESIEFGHKCVNSQAGTDRTNTASTCATDEILLLEKSPFLVEVRLQKAGTPLGLVLSCDDDPRFLTIDGVREPGMVAQWNATHSEELTVQKGQIIASVNGISNSAVDMLAEIKSASQGGALKLLIQPGREGGPYALAPASVPTIVSIDGVESKPTPLNRLPFVVQLKLGRQGFPLGLAVSIDDDPSYVSIDGISSPGLIAEWNHSQPGQFNVSVGDTITAVNRCSGNGRQMLDMLTSIHHLNKGAILQVKIEPICVHDGSRRRNRRF